MTPDVLRNLNRAASEVFGSGGAMVLGFERVVQAIGFVLAAVREWFDQRSAVYETRADADDPEAIAELETNGDDD